MDNTAQAARRQISIWLAAGVVMVLVQIILGGITRLTGSGLSITEWKPLVGAFPPMNRAEWNHSFQQYQQIAQYKKLNNDFTLTDFKALFFWEWLHREWARLMGLVFIIPFIIFLWQRKFDRKLGWQLAVVFLLGTLQGLAGWIMVQSGLNDTDVVVSHIRLAVHFSLALVLLVYLYWMFLSLRNSKTTGQTYGGSRLMTRMIILLLALQLIYGAFMAGTHAALYAPTWPDINGAFFMSSAGITGHFLHRIVYDPLLIQFIHRSLAYLLSCLFLIWFINNRRSPAHFSFLHSGGYPLLLLIIQVSLGIACLLNSAGPYFIWLAVLHQLNAILLLLSMVAVLYRGRSRII